jgi:coenzyme PQQ biosynthesis protein PqqD
MTAASRPKLTAKARLRFDRKTDQYLLLYPERGMMLNPSATAILLLCTGEDTVATIIDRLTGAYTDQGREVIEQELMSFLGDMARRGLVREEL